MAAATGIRVILVPVTAGEAGEAALKTAFALGRRFDAHVAALHVRPDPRNAMPYIGEGMSGVVVQQIMSAAEKDAGERATRARALFDGRSQAAGVRLAEDPTGADGFSASWHDETGREDEVVARRGRLADVLVIGARPEDESGPPMGLVMEAALLESGRPVVIAPPGGAESFGERVAVAWNGSLEAARAVGAGLPVLARAREVTVVAAGPGEAVESAAGEAARYLAWHGIEAATRVIRPRAEATGPAILEEVQRLDADLLIMGAYTHSRFRQMIFGGVTRHVLTQAALPVLVAH